MEMMRAAGPDHKKAKSVAGVVPGDAAAFAQIVHSHAVMLHRIAYRMLGDSASAEDAAQEALLRLWKGGFGQPASGNANVGGWLRRVVTNLCLDQLRRRRFSSADEVPDVEDTSKLADVEMRQDETRMALVAALDTLNERHRAAIILTYYEAMPNAEAAEVMEMNIKAFESLLLRARSALREEIARRGLVTLEDVRDLS
jgi:RNA polymerase sigma factor (sigma-70 family)